jgi:hypothetical protein
MHQGLLMRRLKMPGDCRRPKTSSQDVIAAAAAAALAFPSSLLDVTQQQNLHIK